MTAAEQIEQRTLAATQQPHRLRAIAEFVNEGRPGWDVLSDLEIASVLTELHRRGLVERIEMASVLTELHRRGLVERIEMAYWQAIGRGRL